MRTKFTQIKSSLIQVGWPESIIDLVLHEVHAPHESLDKLKNYIRMMKKQGKGNDEISNLADYINDFLYKLRDIFSMVKTVSGETSSLSSTVTDELTGSTKSLSAITDNIKYKKIIITVL